MSEADNRKVKKIGAITILVAIASPITVALVLWIFSAVVENKMTLAPLVKSMDNLAVIIKETNSANSLERKAIMNTITMQEKRMIANEAKLFRVIVDCKENNMDLRACRVLHNKRKE